MATKLTSQKRKRSSNCSVVWQYFDLIKGNSKVYCREYERHAGAFKTEARAHKAARGEY